MHISIYPYLNICIYIPLPGWALARERGTGLYENNLNNGDGGDGKRSPELWRVLLGGGRRIDQARVNILRP